MRVSLIIPAAGSSLRFQQSVSQGESKSSRVQNKLLVPLQGKPLLLRTLETFRVIPEIQEMIIATLPETKKQIQPHFKKKDWSTLRWVRGGETRAESVLNAIRKTDPKSDWVMVHDGARPLVTKRSIQKLIRTVQGGQGDGAILAKSVVPTIKQVSASDQQIEKTLNRQYLYEAETPQLMKRSVLSEAYQKNKQALQMTDEASLLESIQARVQVVSHEGWNPKITTAEDLRLAEAYLGTVIPETRVGLGRDTHRLVKGRKLYLGGLNIPFDKGALGHSDGDVILHAVTDAVLGVLGQGDIGDWFSDRDPKHKNIESSKMLKTVLKEASQKKWRVKHVDTVLILEKPKLGAWKEKIRKNVSSLLNLHASSVSIKAKTAEGLGPEGEGVALSCEAVLTMEKVQS